MALTVDAIATDGTVNIAEKAAGFAIAGGTGSEGGVSVAVRVGAAELMATSAAADPATWSVSVPANAAYITGTSVAVSVTASKTGFASPSALTGTLGVDLAAPSVSYAAPASLQVGVALGAVTPSTSDTDIASYGVSGQPSGLVIDGTTGAISGTPDTADASTANATVTVKDTAGNPATVSIAFPMVANRVAVVPTVASVELSDAGSDGAYGIGEGVTATVTFSEAVDVTGTPQLEIDVGGNARTLSYSSGTGTAALVFSGYTVAEGHTDPDGIAVGANKLKLNGGTIRKQDSTTVDAVITHVALEADSGRKVDGVRPTPVTSGTNAPRTSVDGTQVILTFSEALSATTAAGTAFTVTVAGVARTVDTAAANGIEVTLTLASAAGTAFTVTVAYTDPTANDDANAVQDAAGNDAATFAAQTVAKNVAAVPTVGLASTAVSAEEGTSLAFEVRLGAASAQTVTVAYATTGVTATQGTDYSGASGTLTFTPGGPLSQTIAVATTEDALDEDDETFTLTLSSPGNATLGTASATGTIADDDSGTSAVSLSLSPGSVAENAGTTTVTVSVSLGSAPRPSDSSVAISVTGGTATAGTDYSAVSAFTVTIGAGETSGTAQVSFEPIEDSLAEGDETAIFTGSAAGLAAGTATLTITDNDQSGSAQDQGPPSITLWTDRVTYQIDQEIRLYLDLDPNGDEREYTVFFCRENIATGERLYLAPRRRSMALWNEVVDQYGRVENARTEGSIERVEAELIWKGKVPYPGLWHFVAEIRSPGTTQVLKRAYAKFAVPRDGAVLLNRRGTERFIETDTRLTGNRVYNLGDRLYVKRGATLTIDAGTVIQAWRPEAAIIVEEGGRIVVRGRREAPVVMTCAAPVGHRDPGCWGGLVVRGTATASSAQTVVESALPDWRVGDDADGPDGSSGELRYLRVEFAGGGSVTDAPSSALVFHDVGSRTVIDHVQVHASAGDGFSFRGGTAHCGYCVVSDTLGDSVAWSAGWQGSAQYLYVHQGAQAASGMHGKDADQVMPSAAPRFYNITLVGGYNIGLLGGTPGGRQSIGPGISLDRGAAIKARNVLAIGFADFAVDGSAASFTGGRSSISEAVLTNSGYSRSGSSQIRGSFAPYIEYIKVNPDLINVRHEANPDPRPRSGSVALRLGNAAVPSFDDRFSRSAHYVGAFGKKNWLEEWTFFGAEQDYEVPVD